MIGTATFFKTLAAIGLAAAFSAGAALFADDGVQFGLEIRPIEFQIFPGYLSQIGNVPVSARTVPIHSGDPGAGTPVVISADSVQPGTYAPMSSAVAPELIYKRIRVRAGAIFSYVPLAPRPREASNGSTQEYNYLQGGNARGTGAALVYYAGVVEPDRTPGVFGEFEIGSGAGWSAIAGYQRTRQNVEIQQGWDRYDSLETYQRLPLSSDVLQQAYAGVRWTARTEGRWKRSIIVLAGPAMVAKQPTALGAAASIRYGQHPFFLTAGVALSLGSRHSGAAQ
jgi:hypothetical protein